MIRSEGEISIDRIDRLRYIPGMKYTADEPRLRQISNVEFVLLQIISQAEEISGYEIGKLVEEREYRVWADIGTTSIYTGLEKLRRKRLVTSHLDVAKRGKGPLPKKFRLTRKGHHTLEKEIEHGLSSTRERDRRFDLALAAIRLLPPQTVINALRKRKQFLREVAKHVNEHFKSLGGEDLPVNIKGLFKHSIHLIRHELEFVDTLLVDLKRTQTRKGAS